MLPLLLLVVMFLKISLRIKTLSRWWTPMTNGSAHGPELKKDGFLRVKEKLLPIWELLLFRNFAGKEESILLKLIVLFVAPLPLIWFSRLQQILFVIRLVP